MIEDIVKYPLERKWLILSTEIKLKINIDPCLYFLFSTSCHLHLAIFHTFTTQPMVLSSRQGECSSSEVNSSTSNEREEGIEINNTRIVW